MKARLQNHLYYHWWIYLSSAVLVVVMWLSVFSSLAQPKADEQINITYIGTAFDHMKLQRDLYEVIPEKTRQNIKRISVENAVIEGEYDLNTVLRARTAGSCDFFIIEETVIEKYTVDYASYFPEVEKAILEKIFHGTEQATVDEKTYGLICDGNINLSKYYSGTSHCKIFFNKSSVNLAGLFGGQEENDAAVRAIQYLTEEQNVQTENS